ncbi:MAG: DUF5990 family protein [Candidatus Andeanibacterium colombiense]|uniref:DUF5990 family protein n=1 Tax=Candidatus Andeanibacterium colombiense TaxID=3121345 RepID=A0AAJ5X150_9SPHN|nr:MAG: DUF5990 family protein [Sphingomonadaceae bacterium]
MPRAGQIEVRMRIVIENPVPGVPHALQQDDTPLDPKASAAGEALVFDFAVRIGRSASGAPKFFGKQVRPEGPTRRFVYIRIGTLAGDPASAWTRRMKIDIHDINPALLEAAERGGALAGTIDGTGKDGSPACATIRPVAWSVI